MIKQGPPTTMPFTSPTDPARVSRHRRLRVGVGVVMVLAIGTVTWLNRAWLGEAVVLVRSVNPWLIAGALVTVLLGYLTSSQVFRVVLRSFGHRVDFLRLWATTITAVVISQSIPAGGVGSYAFFLSSFKRRGVGPSQAALLAALEALSYSAAMLLLGTFSIVYIAVHTIGGSAVSATIVGPLAAAVFAAGVLGGAIFVGTRSPSTLTSWALAIGHRIQRLLRRPRSDERPLALVSELLHSREMIVAQRSLALKVALIQIAALCGHSFALLLVLWSLHVHTSYAVALTAFGIALITSTFNVLPGGGGTVETILIAVLLRFGVGSAALPAAIMFRLLNFWAMLPLALGSYGWLMHGRTRR